MKPFWKSRKFLIAVVDAFAGILSLYITRFLQPEDAKLVLATYAIIQPVLLIWIGSIAWEDSAALKAGSHRSQQED